MSIINDAATEAKTLFTKAIQFVLKEYGYLRKEVDGLWDPHTQDAYSVAAQKTGVDAITATTQQPSKLEHLVGTLKDDVSAKLDELKGYAGDVTHATQETIQAAEAAAPEAAAQVEAAAGEAIADGVKATETIAQDAVKDVEHEKAAPEQTAPEQAQQQEQQQAPEQQEKQEQSGEQSSAEGEEAKQ